VINREISEQAGTVSYVINVEGTQTLYFDCFDKLTNHLTEPINGSFNIYVNGESIESSYPKKNDNGLLNLGTYTDETVDIEVNVLKDVCAQSFGVSGLNLNTLKTAVSQAHTANLKQSGNTIIGTANANGESQYLFLPLPYDDGYSITVNDQQCKIYRVYDAFMAVKLNNGNNTIKISYAPVGFKTGVFLSVIGVLLFCAILIFLRRGLYEKIKFLRFSATILFLLLFIAVFIIVYIFPVFIYFGTG
jgi:hypothetical protein